MVPGNKATKQPQLRLQLSATNITPTLRHAVLQTGTKIQSAGNINKTCNTAELQTTDSPARWIKKKRKGETDSQDPLAAPVRFPRRTVLHHRVQENIDVAVRLYKDTLVPLLATLVPAKQCGTSRILENLPNTLPSSSRALEVLLGANLLCHCHTLRIPQSELHLGSSTVLTYLLRSHRPLVRLPQLVGHPRITSEILLAGDEDYREARAEMHNLRDPL